MQTYTVNRKKRKRALKSLTKENINTLKGFPKACYYISALFKLLTIICVTGNVLYMLFWVKQWYALLLLPITFVAPYSLSLISKVVYVTTITREFSFRRSETITLKPDGFIYSYHDERVGLHDSIFVFDIKYDQITRLERNEKTRVLTLYGNFVTDTYSGQMITQTLDCKVFDFMDIYNIDMKQALEQSAQTKAERQ